MFYLQNGGYMVCIAVSTFSKYLQSGKTEKTVKIV